MKPFNQNIKDEVNADLEELSIYQEAIKNFSDAELSIEYSDLLSNHIRPDKVDLVLFEKIRRENLKNKLHPAQAVMFQDGRLAFTMIELVFVIVILGILAAVAIPKLTATRDDAMIVSAVTNTKQFIKDVTNYYTSQGEFAKPSEMSGVKVDTDTTAMEDLTTNLVVKGKKCVEFKFTEDGSVDGNITISASENSAICDAIIAMIPEYIGTKQLGGKRVKY